MATPILVFEGGGDERQVMAGVWYGCHLAGIASCVRRHVVVDGADVIEHEIFDVTEGGQARSFGAHRTPLPRYAKWVTRQLPAPQVAP